MGLILWAWVKNTVDGVENIDSPIKKKLQKQKSAKKDMLIVFWDMKGPINV